MLRSETAGSVWYEEKNKGFYQVLKLTKEIYPLQLNQRTFLELPCYSENDGKEEP